MAFCGSYPSKLETIAGVAGLFGIFAGTIATVYFGVMALTQYDAKGKLRNIKDQTVAYAIAQNTLREISDKNGIDKFMSKGEESSCKDYVREISSCVDTNVANEWIKQNPNVTIHNYDKTQGGKQ